MICSGVLEAADFEAFKNGVQRIDDPGVLVVKIVEEQASVVIAMKRVETVDDLVEYKASILKSLERAECLADRLKQLPEPPEYQKNEICGMYNRREIELMGLSFRWKSLTEKLPPETKAGVEDLFKEVIPQWIEIEDLVVKYKQTSPNPNWLLISMGKKATLPLRNGYVASLVLEKRVANKGGDEESGDCQGSCPYLSSFFV